MPFLCADWVSGFGLCFWITGLPGSGPPSSATDEEETQSLGCRGHVPANFKGQGKVVFLGYALGIFAVAKAWPHLCTCVPRYRQGEASEAGTRTGPLGPASPPSRGCRTGGGFLKHVSSYLIHCT